MNDFPRSRIRVPPLSTIPPKGRYCHPLAAFMEVDFSEVQEVRCCFSAPCANPVWDGKGGPEGQGITRG